MPPILITTFDTWLPHHRSNASDDLIEAVLQHDRLEDCDLLRKLRVDPAIATETTIAQLEQRQSRLVICCGMAESRDHLTVESGATRQGQRLTTAIDLVPLMAGLQVTAISHDAGNYVCNDLYYAVLQHLQTSQQGHKQCIFVHVPILNPENRTAIVQDFLILLQRLRKLVVQ